MSKDEESHGPRQRSAEKEEDPALRRLLCKETEIGHPTGLIIYSRIFAHVGKQDDR